MSACTSCEIVVINGVRCHETGCPDAWRDETRECKWCGQEFRPASKFDTCCCEDCHESFHG